MGWIHYKTSPIGNTSVTPQRSNIDTKNCNFKRELGVSKNNGTPKSSILIGFSIINHPFRGTPIFGNTQLPFPRPIILDIRPLVFGSLNRSKIFSRISDSFKIAPLPAGDHHNIHLEHGMAYLMLPPKTNTLSPELIFEDAFLSTQKKHLYPIPVKLVS